MEEHVAKLTQNEQIKNNSKFLELRTRQNSRKLQGVHKVLHTFQNVIAK